MITKGIIESVGDYSVVVRMPTLDGAKHSSDATPDELLSTATINTAPNIRNMLNKGDVVFIGFEDNDLSKPIVLGQLYRESIETCADAIFNALITTSVTTLSSNTSIGDVSSSDIQCLKGTRRNIQEQIDEIISRLNDIEE